MRRWLRSLPGQSLIRDADYAEVEFRRRQTGGHAYVTKGQPYLIPWDTDRLVREGYERVIWVWRGVDAYARRAADLTIRSINAASVDQDDKVEVRDPIAQLLNGETSQDETAWMFRYRLSSLSLLSKKGVFVEVLRSRMGRPAHLSLLPVDRTNPVPADPEWRDEFGRRINRSIAGFEVHLPEGEKYVLPPWNPAVPVEEEPSQVLWMRMPHPTNPLTGTTPLEAAGISIDLDFWARMYNRNFMQSDGRPGGVLAIKGRMGEDEASELQSRFNQQAGMPGRTSVIEADAVSWVDTTTTPRDAQYVESRALTKEDILEALGATHILGGTGSYDEVSGRRAIWWEEQMLPHLGFIEHGLEPLTAGGRGDNVRLWHDTSKVGPLQHAKLLRKKQLMEEAQAGGITWDEYRAETGRSEMGTPESRVLWLPGGKMPIGAAEDQTAALALAQRFAVAQQPSAAPGTEPRQTPGIPSPGEENPTRQFAQVTASPPRPALPAVPHEDENPMTPTASRRALRAVKADSYQQAGVMIALHPSRGNALALLSALPPMPYGTELEPVDDFHVTLAFMGTMAEVTPQHIRDAGIICEQLATEYGEVSGAVSALTSWQAGERDSVVALVDAPGLTALREDLVKRLDEAGIPVRKEHGYSPHLTVGYAPLESDAPTSRTVRGFDLPLSDLALSVGENRASFHLSTYWGPGSKALGGVPERQTHGGWIWQGAPGGGDVSLAGRRFRTASQVLTDRQVAKFTEQASSQADVELATRLGVDDQLDPLDLNRLANWFRGAGAERAAAVLDRYAKEGEAPEPAIRRARVTNSAPTGWAEPGSTGYVDAMTPRGVTRSSVVGDRDDFVDRTVSPERAPAWAGGAYVGSFWLTGSAESGWSVYDRSALDEFEEEVHKDRAVQHIFGVPYSEAVEWAQANQPANELRADADYAGYRGTPSPYESLFPEVRIPDRRPDGDGPEQREVRRTRDGKTRKDVLEEAEQLGVGDELATMARDLAGGTMPKDADELDRVVIAAWESSYMLGTRLTAERRGGRSIEVHDSLGTINSSLFGDFDGWADGASPKGAEIRRAAAAAVAAHLPDDVPTESLVPSQDRYRFDELGMDSTEARVLAVQRWTDAWNGGWSPQSHDLSNAAAVRHGREPKVSEHLGGDMGQTWRVSDERAALAVYDAIYANTQEVLADRGITHLRLARGLRTSEWDADRGEDLTSWTTSREIADSFSLKLRADREARPLVVEATFPASAVFSLGISGPGTLAEQEVLIADNTAAMDRAERWGEESKTAELVPTPHGGALWQGRPGGPGAPDLEAVASVPTYRPASPEDRKRLRIPPAWTDVIVADSEDAPLQARGKDAKGRDQRLYSAAHTEAQAAAKFKRTQRLMREVGKLDEALERDAATDDSAAALLLIRRMGLRPGSTTDTGAETQAFGATTLRAEHVKSSKEGLVLHFTGKKGVELALAVDDDDVAAMLRKRLEGLQPGAELFPGTNERKVNAYMDRHVDSEFKVKDLRTLLANALAVQAMREQKKPTTRREFQAARKRVAEQVSARLGNTPTVALASYINPTVFGRWEGGLS